jgi:hypothetical protein
VVHCEISQCRHKTGHNAPPQARAIAGEKVLLCHCDIVNLILTREKKKESK